jgi:hypothetical protein
MQIYQTPQMVNKQKKEKELGFVAKGCTFAPRTSVGFVRELPMVNPET